VTRTSFLLIGWAIILASLVLFSVLVVRDAWRRREAAERLARSLEATGEIIRSDQRGSRTGALHLDARFRVGRQEYEADNKRGNPEGLGIREAMARYPVGAKVTVYYDPDNPSNAAFTRDVTWRRRAMGAGVVSVLTVLFAGLPLFLRQRSRKRLLPPRARVISTR
jgi:hypothetical protein